MSISADERPSVTRPPNRQLSALIEQAGMSNKQLARAIRETAARHGRDARCTHTSVQRWRDGRMSRAVPPPLIAETLSLALGRVITTAEIGMAVDDRPVRPPLATEFSEAPEEVAAAASRLWVADLGRSTAIHADLPVGALAGPALHWLLAQDAPAPPGVGPGPEVAPADVRRLQDNIRAYELIARRHGGGAAHRPAVQYLLTDLGPLLTGRCSADVGRELSVAAALGVLAVGHSAHDSNLHGLGRRYHLLALFLAHQAGDRVLGAQALVALAASFTAPGDQAAVLDLLRAAVLGTRHEPEHARAAVHAAEARAHARLRDAAAAERSLARAREAVAERTEADAAGTANPAAGTANPFGPQDLAEAEIVCRLALGEYAQARRCAEEALSGHGPDDVVRAVLVRCLLAAACVRSGRLDGACDAVDEALRQAAGLQSATVDAQLGRLAADLEAQRGAGRPAALAALIRGRRPADTLAR